MSASEGEVVGFELVGGPACGATIALPLRAAGETYLVEICREDLQVRYVWSYEFANRTSQENGYWILDRPRYCGFRGMPVESPEQGGAK
jgi:hypothetical protein